VLGRGSRAAVGVLLEGGFLCRSFAEVKDYLDALAEQVQREGKPCVVVVEDAPFHIESRDDSGEGGGMGGEGAEVVSSAILLPAPEADRGGVEEA
jgi:hypothetical protein